MGVRQGRSDAHLQRTNTPQRHHSAASLVFQDGQKDCQQGRSERRGESYFLLYVEPPSDARTPLAGYFIILARGGRVLGWEEHAPNRGRLGTAEISGGL